MLDQVQGQPGAADGSGVKNLCIRKVFVWLSYNFWHCSLIFLLHIRHFKMKQMRPRGFPNMLLTGYV